ncbi:hypothetical protein E1B28_001090 [Marasmius oreades]|uniref:Uncharacterized protein n=1 Tax=Marasmius oreades TaxID=181124 RepID=A0A9P8AF26_9AGAR|nr:uncharacterized protein E1B28_001090 [Marasmius oreades]KAG7099224.1 hypothetical protein E1B28_001090 [Marasmius oreades]
MDFIQRLDPSKLVQAGTWLSFITALFTSPSYNLPIFLFGSYAQENNEASQSLQTFTALLGGSCVIDIVWMIINSSKQGRFSRFLTILLLLLKIPTFLAFGLSLRQRGAQFGGLGIRGNDLSGPTVWSMPGGFTSTGRDGYQAMDEESHVESNRPPPLPVNSTTVPPPTTNMGGPGAYQTL